MLDEALPPVPDAARHADALVRVAGQLSDAAALFVCLLLLAFSGHANAQEKKDGPEKKTLPKIDPAKVAELIRQLGSDDFSTRHKATKELSNLDELPGALRDAVKSGDPEVSSRASKAIRVITDRIEEREFQAMMRELAKIELDRFLRRMVTDKEFGAGDKQWEVLEAIVKVVTKKANEQGSKDFGVPALAMKTMPLVFGVPDAAKRAIPPAFFPKGSRIILNDKSSFDTAWNCVVLCSGRMERCIGLENCIVIVDGDFVGATGMYNCLLIVRGNVGSFTQIRNSIILATGEFEGTCGDFNNSFLQAKNPEIGFFGSTGSVVLNTKVKTCDPTDCNVLKVKKGPLQLLKFSKTEKR